MTNSMERILNALQSLDRKKEAQALSIKRQKDIVQNNGKLLKEIIETKNHSSVPVLFANNQRISEQAQKAYDETEKQRQYLQDKEQSKYKERMILGRQSTAINNKMAWEKQQQENKEFTDVTRKSELS